MKEDLCSNGSEVETFKINRVTMTLPKKIISGSIREALVSKKYERLEANQIPRFLREGDKVLEFGGGIGFISSLALALGRVSEYTVIEANPELIPIIRAVHKENNVSATVINGVCIGNIAKNCIDIDEDGCTSFYISENFWGSSLKQSKYTVNTVKVPVFRTEEFIEKYRPDCLIVDIEGGEIDLFRRVKLSGVRHVFLEVHKNVFGLKGLLRLVRIMARQGFCYDPDYSVGATVMFSRVA